MNKELEERINDLLMFAVSGNADDLSDYMRDRQKETVKLIKLTLTPPTADEIVKEFQKTRTYETVVYRDCGDFALLNDKNKGHYELSNIYCIVSKSSLDFPFGTTLKLAHKITSFFMSLEEK